MGFWSKIKAAVRVVVSVVIEVVNRVTLGVLDLLLGFFAGRPNACGCTYSSCFATPGYAEGRLFELAKSSAFGVLP